MNVQATKQNVHSKPLFAAPGGGVRPVFCVIEHACQNREIADDACAGIFTNAGLRLDVGLETDWLANGLQEDEEWWIEWYKFYFGLNLAHAFAETSDHKYLRTWERLVRSWMRQVPVGFDSTDVEARRIQNWIYAWNVFRASDHQACFADGFEAELVVRLAQQVDHLRQNLTAERNHRTLEIYALFIAAIALPHLADDDVLLTFAMKELHANLLQDFRADGVHREQSTHYHMTVLRSFLGARENARRRGLRFPDSYDERLQQACEFALHVHRPDGLIPALSDSDTGSYLDLLKLGGDLFNRPDFLYVASSGVQGIPPGVSKKSFPDGGYFVQRSGWGEGSTKFQNERYLIFDCGPLGDGGHGHYDLLNIEVAANSGPLIVDPGRFTYEDNAAGWRQTFKGTAAHNTVCVDDLDQTPYHRGKPKGQVARGRLLELLTAPGFDMLCGEARSPEYEAVHTRRIFFVAGEYWLIIDSLRGNVSHKFDLRFHLTPEAWNHCTSLKESDNAIIRTPDMALVFESHLDPKVEMGWVSPLYGIKREAPVVSVVDHNRDADFFTLITPLKLESKLPRLRVVSPASQSLANGLVEISAVGPNQNGVDTIAWGSQCKALSFPETSLNTSAAWRRTSNEGQAPGANS